MSQPERREPRIAFMTPVHDDTHVLLQARDYAGVFYICAGCVHLRLDEQARSAAPVRED